MDEDSTPLVTSSESGSQDWAVMIKDSIAQYAERENVVGPDPRKVMRRVPQAVRELNPKHYMATELPVGLFNRTPLDPIRTRADRCKVAMATAVLEEIAPIDWDELCSLVVPNPKEIQALYDEVHRHPFSPREVQSVLTLDAVFLAGYLGTLFHYTFALCFPTLQPAVDRILEKHKGGRILSDLLKVENQIPLSLIRTVLHILVTKSVKIVGRNAQALVQHALSMDNDELVDSVLARIYWDLVPHFRIPGCDSGDSIGATEDLSLLECDTFLHCAYRTTMRHNDTSKDGDNVEGWVPKPFFPTATELRKAGIEFHGRKGFCNMEFKAGIINGTLFIPTLSIDGGTEQFWKNLVAYEQMTSLENDDFTQYLYFMDRLIDSANDVMILRSGRFPTITNSAISSNEAVAKLFNEVCKNSLIGSNKKWSKLHQQICDFYSKKRRQMYVEFKKKYFGKPWLTVSVAAAVVLLVLTFLQTYFTIAGYYQNL